nr:hypothetical protein NG677_17350 [Methylobacterium sp. OTU13CASTA1]
MPDAELNIDTTIFCEDVRREEGGKLFIIGCYVADFMVGSFPISLTMVVHNQGTVVSPGTVSTSIIIKDQSDGILFESEPTEEAEFFQGRFALAHQFQIVVQRESTLHITVRNGSREYALPTRRVQIIRDGPPATPRSARKKSP